LDPLPRGPWDDMGEFGVVMGYPYKMVTTREMMITIPRTMAKA